MDTFFTDNKREVSCNPSCFPSCTSSTQPQVLASIDDDDNNILVCFSDPIYEVWKKMTAATYLTAQ
jgi:hypothetical protein